MARLAKGPFRILAGTRVRQFACEDSEGFSCDGLAAQPGDFGQATLAFVERHQHFGLEFQRCGHVDDIHRAAAGLDGMGGKGSESFDQFAAGKFRGAPSGFAGQEQLLDSPAFIGVPLAA